MTDYGATDTSTTTLGTNQFPANSVFVPGDTKLTVVQGGPKGTDVNGKTYTPVAEYVPDGNDVAQGLTTDAAVTGDNAGTLSAKLRGLSKIFTDVWDSVNHRLHVNVDAGSITANAGTNLNTSALALEAGHLATIDSHIPAQGQALAAASVPVVLTAIQQTALTPPAAITGFALEAGHLANIDTHTPAQGQATMANSRPVVIASNQSTLPTNILDVSAAGNITSASGAGSTVVAVFGAGVTSWSIDLRGTFSAGTTLQFEGTVDGTNFFSVFGVPIGATTDAPVSNVVGGAAIAYQGNATGLQQFRIRCSALQASDNVTVKIIGSVASDGGFLTKAIPAGSNTIGNVGINAGSALIGNVELVDSAGTNKAAIDAAGNQQVKGGFTEQSGLSAGALNADLVPSTDVSGYAWLSLHITAIATGGTITFQASNDNFVTVESVNLARVSSSSTTATTSATTGMFEGPINFRYFRARQTAWTSGSTTGVLELFTVPRALNTMPIAQGGIWTVQPGNTPNTTPWLVTTAGLPTGLASYVIKEVKNVAVTAGTGASIWTPAAGKKFRLIGWELAPVTAAAVAGIQFQDTVTYNTANEFLRTARYLSTNFTPLPKTIGPNGYLSTTINNQLWIDVTATTNVEGFVYGFEE